MRGPSPAVSFAAAFAGLALLAGAAAQSPQPVTQADCPDLPTAHVFKEWPTGLENLAFAGGAVYVSDVGEERLLRIDPDGRTEVVAAFADLHGVIADVDGVVHFTGREEVDAPWRVWRLGADGPEPYSGPTLGWNGMAFSDTGDLYITDLFGEGIYRIPADDPARSDLWLRVDGANGLSHDSAAGILYAAVMFDQRSLILRIPIADPDAATEIHLSFGAINADGSTRPPSDPRLPLLPKVLDDLTLGPDGWLYVAAHGAGELLRVDPESGAACVLAKDLKEPTSVRVASGFPPYNGDLFVTTFGGNFYSTLLDGALADQGLPAPGAVPREPQLMRIATAFEMPDLTTEDGTSTPPTPTRGTPVPVLAPLLAPLLAGPIVRSRRQRRSERRKAR